jgi:CYTH domain-containing protein
MAIEIERRFLLLPMNVEEVLNEQDLLFKKIKIEQFYVSSSEDAVERYRHSGSRFVHTKKVGFGMMREEFESEVSEEVYLKQKEKNQNKNLIKKIRYLAHCEDNILEIDVFEGALKGLVILEVEFYSKDDSKKFTLPRFLRDFFVKEITLHREFTNGYLSKIMRIPSLSYDLKEATKKIDEAKDELYEYSRIKLPPYQSIGDSIKILSYMLAIVMEKRVFALLEEPKSNLNRIKQLKISIYKLFIYLDEFEITFKKGWRQKRLKALESLIDSFELRNKTNICLDKFYIFEELSDNKNLLKDIKDELISINNRSLREVLRVLRKKKVQKLLKHLKHVKSNKDEAKTPSVIFLNTLINNKISELLNIIHTIDDDIIDDEMVLYIRDKIKSLKFIFYDFANATPRVVNHDILDTLDNLERDFESVAEFSIQIQYLKFFRENLQDIDIKALDILISRVQEEKIEQKLIAITLLKALEETLQETQKRIP